jgi:hypothetical protein
MSDLILTLLATLARALLAHSCGEALHWLLDHIAPGIPALVGGGIGLVMGVTLVEIILAFWHRRSGADHEP